MIHPIALISFLVKYGVGVILILTIKTKFAFKGEEIHEGNVMKYTFFLSQKANQYMADLYSPLSGQMDLLGDLVAQVFTLWLL